MNLLYNAIQKEIDDTTVNIEEDKAIIKKL